MLRRDEEGRIKATRLGRIAVRFQLSPETVTAWACLIEQVADPTFFDLLLAVCASPDMNGSLRCELEYVARLQAGLDAEASAIKGVQEKDRPRMLLSRGRSLVGAVQAALALRAWTRLGDFVEAGAAAACEPHEVEELKKEALRMLQAMSALVSSGLDEKAGDKEAGEKRERSDLEWKLMALRAMVSAGLADEQATLAMVEGIGPVLGRRLIAAGINDVEDLALADLDALLSVDGVSTKRAQQWLDAAGELVGAGGAFRFREAPRQVQGSVDGTEGEAGPMVAAGLDYFRWLRASSLKVDEAGADRWLVSGGSQPHQVLAMDGSYSCDCRDAEKGRLCKHAIAVRHAQKDPEIPRFEGAFMDAARGEGDAWDLFRRWGQRV